MLFTRSLAFWPLFLFLCFALLCFFFVLFIYQGNGDPDYTDVSKTENTRVSYPIYHIDNYEPSGMGGHPNSIVFLTCDAFGVLPPVSRLSAGQVIFKKRGKVEGGGERCI